MKKKQSIHILISCKTRVLSLLKYKWVKKKISWASLVAQQWRIRLPMQGSIPGPEDPTYCTATRPVHPNSQSLRALEPGLPRKRSRDRKTSAEQPLLEASREKPLQKTRLGTAKNKPLSFKFLGLKLSQCYLQGTPVSPVQRVWVQSLVRELKSHSRRAQTKKKYMKWMLSSKSALTFKMNSSTTNWIQLSNLEWR